MSESSKHLLFRLGRGHYAVPITQVREIIRRPEITPLPGAPEAIEGLFNLRGEVYAVVNLRRRFNLRSDEDAAAPGCGCEALVLLLDIGEENMAALVDGCYSVEEISEDEVVPAPEDLVLNQEIRAAVYGIVRRGERVLLMVDSYELLPPEQLARLAELKEVPV
ncbi:MAG: chemotaxis protein CheW [Thermoleophilia bacterium]